MPPPHHHHPPKHGPQPGPHGHPHHGPHQGPGRRHAVPASQALDFVDAAQLETLLAPLLPDAGDRGFVVRCLIGEGPIHHRGANYVLLSLLARALQAQGLQPQPASGTPVPMRLPPHLAESVDEGVYPLALPVQALEALAGGNPQHVAAMVDCLTDGPPQHALANVVMVTLLERLLPPPAGTPPR